MGKSRLTRISMTVPVDLLRKADQAARGLDRSRSWVIAEAIRRLDLGAAHVVSERSAAGYLTTTPLDRGPDPYRATQLESDLKLTPTERVIAAERTAREAPPRAFGRVFVAFDRTEDYLEWKQLEATGLL